MLRDRFLIIFMILFVACLTTNQSDVHCQDAQSTSKSQATTKQETDDGQDWARGFLDQNPLETKSGEELTLADLEEALKNPQQQAVLMRHFRRANLSTAEAGSFLRKALQSQSLELRIETAIELQRRGELTLIIRERLVDSQTDEDADVARAAERAVVLADLPDVDLAELPEFLAGLVEQLRTGDLQLQEDARAKFRQLGLYGVPTLLKLLNDDDPALRESAALLLGEILVIEKSARLDHAREEKPVVGAGALPPPKSGAQTSSGPVSVRIQSDEPLQKVRVFYGTNRKIIDGISRTSKFVWWLPPVFFILLFLFVRHVRQPRRGNEDHPGGHRSFFIGVFLFALMLATAWYWNLAIQRYWSLHEGVRFGPVRDLPDVIHYGDCIVSLPPSHESGELERPWLGPENEQIHVVLRRTSLMEEGDFYQAVKQQLGKLPSTSRDCFIFVHGFNVSFEDAAMRTAQIAFDLKVSGEFEGIPLFYSWPSAASPILYSWDRAEIRNSKSYLKQFLENVAANIDADKIHIVAHSMGADLVTQAISDIDSDKRLFHQIVLAAPDIDRDVFRRDIVPALAEKSVRTTMYCSSNDFALQISYRFNHARRIGDTSDDVFVIDGVDTVDASEMPTDLLGHSYYGDCVPLAADIASLMKRNASPNSEERNLHSMPWHELFYWVFGD